MHTTQTMHPTQKTKRMHQKLRADLREEFGISRDVEPGALALARARQENKPGFATRFFARLRALKSQMGKGA